jgi:hypothetical protein
METSFYIEPYDKVLVLETGKNKKSAQTMQAQNRFFPYKNKKY